MKCLKQILKIIMGVIFAVLLVYYAVAKMIITEAYDKTITTTKSKIK